MELNKSLKTSYTGYELQGFAESLLTRKEVKTLYRKLYRIPPKISAFINRKTIKEVFKYDSWTYFVIDTNNKIFVLDY